MKNLNKTMKGKDIAMATEIRTTIFLKKIKVVSVGNWKKMKKKKDMFNHGYGKQKILRVPRSAKKIKSVLAQIKSDCCLEENISWHRIHILILWCKLMME